MPPDHGCDGETVSSSLHSSSQTSVTGTRANLIDHCGPLADEAGPHPMRRLLVGFGWNETSRWPLNRLGYSMGISEIILVPLPKRLRIRGRNPLHIVTKCG